MEPDRVGETRICRWKGDRRAAFSIGGDDSLRSQLTFAIPEMDKRGICGTWWVNPGRGGPVNYKHQDDAWANCWIACYEGWIAAARRGHDFANHSMHHLGAAGYAEAEREIREAAEAIWKASPTQRLQLFDRGGGTTWQISDRELDEILKRYDCVEGRGGGIEDPTWEVDPSAQTLIGYVDAAILEGSWHHLAFHGVGANCEWGGPVDGEAFIALLDYLVVRRDLVWAGTHTEVHKYDQERQNATVSIQEASTREIRVDLSSTAPYRLYDYPLTLNTRIPDGWEAARVIQGSRSMVYRPTGGKLQFEAVPGEGEIHIMPEGR